MRDAHSRAPAAVLGPISESQAGAAHPDRLGPVHDGGAQQLRAAVPPAAGRWGAALICADWTAGQDLWGFVDQSLSNPTSPLLVSAERSLAAEFPEHAQARSVLAAIGSGERTFTNISKAAGGIAATPLQRALEVFEGYSKSCSLASSNCASSTGHGGSE
jgi:uncharacterized protein